MVSFLDVATDKILGFSFGPILSSDMVMMAAAIAIELNGVSVRAWTALGQLQERTQDLAGAEQSYRKAVALCGDQTRECGWPLLELGLYSPSRKKTSWPVVKALAPSCLLSVSDSPPVWTRTLLKSWPMLSLICVCTEASSGCPPLRALLMLLAVASSSSVGPPPLRCAK